MIKNYLNILKTFKYSINIKSDYLDSDKINSYMPTFSNMKLISKFIQTIDKKNNKSFLLSGAYGTGKSYLVSVFLHLINGNCDLSKVSDFIKKAKHEYSHTEEILKTISDKKYLVVFIDDVYSDFKQNLLNAITKESIKNKIDIDLQTIYKIVLSKIESWKDGYDYIYNQLVSELKDRSISIEKFIFNLENSNHESYCIFESIYEKIFANEKFIAINSLNKVEEFLTEFEKSVLNIGYNGIIYVFDEFGRYLETNIKKIDVKEVQDMAEYCNGYNNSSFIVITHKDLFQYSGKIKNKEQKSEWDKVNGRFVKESLIYEKQNISEVITKILSKNDLFNEFYRNNSDYFSNTTTKNYPLTNIAFKILPNLSQKLAQNERTLFSFLCSDETNSLNDLLTKLTKKTDLITLNYLYDYFENNFKFLDTNSYDYKTYLNTKNILSKLDDSNKINIMKSLSLIYINNNFSEIEPSPENLLKATNIDESQFHLIIKDLIKDDYILQKNQSKHFKIMDGIEINVEKEIREYIEKKQKIIDYIDVISQLIPLGFYYPIKYNYEYNITRYLKKYYLDTSNLMKINSYLDTKTDDGKIIYLLDIENKNSITDNLIKLSKEKDFILIINENDKLNIIDEVKQLDAILKISESDKKYEDNILKEELFSYKKELKLVIETEIDNYFKFEKIIIYIKGEKKDIKNYKDFMTKISEYLENKYIFYKGKNTLNYELINKTNLTPQIKKARIDILKKITNDEITDEYFNETGSENSIARILLLNKKIYVNGKVDFINSDFSEVYYDIMNKIKKEKITFEKLYDEYVYNNSKYGFRKGFFTFLLFLIIQHHNEELIINYNKGNEEILFDELLIDKIETNLDKYELSYVVYDEESINFINKITDLLKLYVNKSINQENKSMIALKAFKSFLLQLPKMILLKDFNDNSKLNSILKGILVENNSKDFWFKKIQKIYESNNLDEVYKKFNDDISFLKNKELELKNRLINVIKNIFEISEINLLKNLKDKIKEKNLANYISQSINNEIENCKGNDEIFLLNITERLNGFNYYNWRDETNILTFENKLKESINLMVENDKIKSKIITINLDKEKEYSINVAEDYSLFGNMLKSKILSDLKNMGASVTKEEKRKILLDILMEG